MKLYIKNMVCPCCKVFVKGEIEKLGLHCANVELGEVEIEENISVEQCEQLRNALLKAELELVTEQRSLLVEKIKQIIIELVYSDAELKINFSEYLSKTLNHNYNYLANLFSEEEQTTVEHFYISNKVQRVKDLLMCEELTLTEISYKLHYCSLAHLSSQFKKVTGTTPTLFRQLKRTKVLFENKENDYSKEKSYANTYAVYSLVNNIPNSPAASAI